MANGKIRFGKQSGGQLALVIPDGVDNTEVVIPESGELATKQYVDNLRTIATGTATFTATTNNINLTGIGIGVEIGDVIQISGAEDVKNNSEFTVEVITDDDNIIVNQAHANKGTSKNVAARSGDTGVTVKLLAKWYNANIGLGRGRINVTSSRILGNTHVNNTGRPLAIVVRISLGIVSAANLTIGSETSGVSSAEVIVDNTLFEIIAPGETYKVNIVAGTGSIFSFHEIR